MAGLIDVAYVEIIPDLKSFNSVLNKELKSSLNSLNSSFKKASDDIDNSLTGAFKNVGKKGTAFGAGLGKAFTIGFGSALASGAGSLATSAVALFAPIGAAAAAAIPGAIVAFGTLKLAISGVGDALKNLGDTEKFAEALAKLSPEAQKFALAAKEIYPQLTAIKSVVQDRFFQGLGADLKAVTANLAGPLKSGLAAVSTQLNGLVKEVAEFAKSPKAIQAVNALFGITGDTLNQLDGILTKALNTAADFIIKLGESGKINEIFATAGKIISSLAVSLGNVGLALNAVFTGLAKNGLQVGQSLELATGALYGFLSSAEGQDLIASLAMALQGIQNIFLELLKILPSLAPALSGLIQGGFGVLLPILNGILEVLGPFAEALGGQKELFTFLGAAIAIAVVALKAYQLWQVLSAAATAAGTLIINAQKVALFAWNAVMIVVRGAIIAWTAVQWLLNIALTANPIGLVIVAIVALIAAVIWAYNNFDSFRAVVDAVGRALVTAFVAVGAFFVNVWNTIKSSAVNGWNSVLGVIRAIPGQIAALGSSFYNAGLNLIKGFFNGLGAAASFAGNIGRSIYAAFRNGLNSAIGQINNGIAVVDSVLPGSLPRIPYLASGGIVTGPTTAMIGEAGDEAVLPLSGNRAKKAFDNLGIGGTQEVNFQPGAIAISFEGVVPTESEAARTGEAVTRGILGVLARRDTRVQIRTV